MCAYRLRLARSLEEKRSQDCDLVPGPQKLEFLGGLLSCQGVREEYAPSLFGNRAGSVVSVEPVEV